MYHKGDFCELKDIPEEVTINITSIMKVEKLVSSLLTYKRAGIQVIKITGYLKKLGECPEILKQVAKEVSIFVDEPDILPKNVKRYVENA